MLLSVESGSHVNTAAVSSKLIFGSIKQNSSTIMSITPVNAQRAAA